MAKIRAKGSRDTLDKVIAKLKACAPKKGAQGTFEVSRGAGELLSRIKYTLSSGLDVLDSTCGGFKMPGFPFGRITEIYGLDASGKTALVMKAMSMAHRRKVYDVTEGTPKWIGDDIDVTVLFVDNEQSVADGERLIIDGEELDAGIARCDTVDLLFKIVDITIDAIVAVEKETGRKQLIVIVVDTIAGTSSKEEMTQEWGKDDYNRQPKQLREGFRQLIRKIARHDVCMICTNQVSDSFKPKMPGQKRPMTNVPDPDDFNTFGGRALKFYARLRLFVYKLPIKFTLLKGTKFPAGFVAGFKTIKNSQAKPLREGRFVLEYEGGLSNDLSTLEHLVFMGLAKRDEDGGYLIRFSAAKIETTTFAAGEEPYVPSRAEWLPFCESHRADVDALLKFSVELMFAQEQVGAESDIVSDEDEEEEDVLASAEKFSGDDLEDE